MIIKVIGLIICMSYLVFAICILTFFMDKCNKDKKDFFMFIFISISVIVNLLVQFLMYVDCG